MVDEARRPALAVDITAASAAAKTRPVIPAGRASLAMWTQASSGDEVVLGVAGPPQAPVTGADHHSEVEGYDQVVE